MPTMMSAPTQTALTLHLFGPPDIRIHGEPMPRLRSKKGLFLLTLLILRYDRDVEREWLAGTLWPDSEETHAFMNLRQTLTDLRRALGEEAARLLSPTSRTLRFDLTDTEVDVIIFDTALARGDLASLEQAISVYRGPLLDGLLEEWIPKERESREQAYLQALQTLAEQALASDKAHEAARYLRLAVAADPLRESAYRELMTALAASGDYAAVTEIYRQLRLTLREAVNAEPMEETKALFQRLRAEARLVASAPRPARPAAVEVRPEPIPATSSSLYRLPRSLTNFIGREQELENVKGCLKASRCVTLTGPGGVGKTRLAAQAAEQMAEEYPEGAWFVDLAPLSDQTLVAQAVTDVLGITEQAGLPLAETLCRQIHERRLLLIMDNCEHVIEACAELITSLLQGCPNLTILATSREALSIPGEWNWPVSPLPLPDLSDGRLSFPDLPQDDEPSQRTQHPSLREKDYVACLMENPAARLFVERAHLVQPAFRLTNQNAPTVEQVCRRLDGIPLAIELAAACMKALDVAQIASRLSDRFQLLVRGNRTALPRHQTLRATIDWSYSLLSEGERILLRRLSIFTGGWALEAAEAICSDKDEGGRMKDEKEILDSSFLEDWEVLGLLGQLVDKSLVIVENWTGGQRYRFLETVRQYAQARLEETDESLTLAEKHHDWFLQLAEEAEPHLEGPDQKSWLDRLEAEHENLRQALKWSLKPDKRLRLANALFPFWSHRGHLREARGWLEGALVRSDTRPSPMRARVLHRIGQLAMMQGDYTATREWWNESLAIRQALEDRSGQAAMLNALGVLAHEQGDMAAARTSYEQSRQLFAEQGDRQGMLRVSNNLGIWHYIQGEYAVARTMHEQTLALARELGNTRGEVSALGNLAETCCAEGDFTQARELWEQCLTVDRELDYKWGIASTLTNLGYVAQRLGNLPRAYALHCEGLALCWQIGDQRLIAHILECLAGLAVQTGQHKRAARLLGGADKLREVMHTPIPLAHQQEIAENISATHTTLGEAAYTANWSEGSKMTVERLVHYALGETM